MKEIKAEVFSQILREARTRLGYTQESLAEAIDCAHATINRWENKGNKPNYIDFYKLMHALDLTFEELSGLEKLPKALSSKGPSLKEALDVVARETGIVIKLPKLIGRNNIDEDLYSKISSLGDKELELLKRTVDKMASTTPATKGKANQS